MPLGTEQGESWLNPDAKVLVESFLQAVAGAPRSLLMLDYDGTLAPFHEDRQGAFPYPGISQVVQRIVHTGKTRVVIVSGRDAKEVIPLLGIEPNLEFWGLHGSQRLKADGSANVAPLDDHTAKALETAKDWLRDQDLQDAAEFKTGSIAVHWRGLSETEASAVRVRVLLGWTPIARQSGLKLLAFDGGVEIRAYNPNKGDAVRTILSEMDSHAPVAYLGDDITDEQAFQALNEYSLGGQFPNDPASKTRHLTVLVRSRWRQTAAQVWLRPPDEVLALLERWLQASRDGSNQDKPNQNESNRDEPMTLQPTAMRQQL
jgi:trehalose 6-phosphate phosphatase